MKLFNATGQPQHLLVDGELVEVPVVEPIHIATGPDLTAGVAVDELECEVDGRSTTLELMVDTVLTVVAAPDRVDDVLYLVDQETLAAWPARDDFVAPSMYQQTPGGLALVAVTRTFATVPADYEPILLTWPADQIS